MSQFEDLRDAAAVLNTATDSYRKLVDDFDAKLAGLNLGIELWVDVDGSDDPASHDLKLGYSRVNADDWGLMISVRDAKKRFNESSRANRIRCVGSIGVLLTALANEALKTTLALEQALEGAHSILKDMGIPERRKG